jgi:O-antigen/teichoic acid export membrane protein
MAVRLFGLGIIILGPGLLAAHLLLTWVYHFTFSFDFMLVGGGLVLPTYFYLPIIYALYRADQQMAVLKINLAGTGINFVLNLILLPTLGLLGALLASTMAQWAMLAAYLYLNKGLQQTYASTLSKLSSTL